MLEQSTFMARLKQNYHMRKDSLKGTWGLLKNQGLAPATRKKLDDMGTANRALVGRR